MASGLPSGATPTVRARTEVRTCPRGGLVNMEAYLSLDPRISCGGHLRLGGRTSFHGWDSGLAFVDEWGGSAGERLAGPDAYRSRRMPASVRLPVASLLRLSYAAAQSALSPR